VGLRKLASTIHQSPRYGLFNAVGNAILLLLVGRGLHSSTFQLNLSALNGTGGARRGCVARVYKGVLGGI